MIKRSPFKYFKTSPEIIRLAVMLYVRFPLSLRNVEDLLHERGIDVSHETTRFWWNRFGPMDKVSRQCRAPAPNLLCFSDFTYVATWQWFVYVAFVIDVFAVVSLDGASVAQLPRASRSTLWSKPFINSGRPKTNWCIIRTADRIPVDQTNRVIGRG